MHCSTVCKNKHNSIKGEEKRKATCLEKFGSVSNLSTKEHRDAVKAGNIKKYGVDHHMNRAEVKEKMKNTMLYKYGVENISQSEDIKLKKEATSLINYGDTHHNKTDIGKKERKDTCMEKYGVSHFSKTDGYKEKYVSTSLHKYGTINPAQSEEVREKISRTMKDKYGCHYSQQHISHSTLEKLSDKAWLEENSHKSYTEISNILGDITYHTVVYAFDKLGIEYKYAVSSISLAEKEIVAFLESHGLVCQTNVRDMISPKEIDIYVPSLNLAIEYNGLYWHSEVSGKKHTKYHKDKTDACSLLGIKLIHIWDAEWEQKKDLVKGRLLSMCGLGSSIAGRKCTVKLVPDKNTVREFLDKNHIQGWCPSSKNYALYHQDEIVSLMTFGKSRFTKGVEWELLRFCNKIGHRVQGGASKLFKSFINDVSPSSIVSYADLRWNTGGLYETLGFTHSHTSSPNYFYTKNYSTLENRVKYQKHKLSGILETFDPALSETQNMFNNGYDRVWDCGNSVWIYTT